MTTQTEAGFTLIELLVVIAIIGILAAISLAQFAEYKMRAWDSRAVGDLRTVATAEEGYFVDHEEYASCADAECETVLSGLDLSTGSRVNVTGTDNQFETEVYHPRGAKLFRFDSDEGKIEWVAR